MVFTKVNTVVVAPIPRARVRMANTEKMGGMGEDSKSEFHVAENTVGLPEIFHHKGI